MGIEILSFTYLLIDIGMFVMLGLGIASNWILIAISIPLYFLYPFIYEPLLKLIYGTLGFIVKDNKKSSNDYQELPLKSFIVYDPIYNIRLCGIEKQHPFDAIKYERTLEFLNQYDSDADWSSYHKTSVPRYSFIYPRISLFHLIFLNYSIYLSKIAELPVCWLPSIVLRLFVLRRFYFATQGSLDAADLAVNRGVGVNLGGGFHHAHADGASGFCFINDIGLVIQHLRLRYPDKIKRIMIIDLDAHQGNGHERDKLKMPKEEIYILDAYHQGIFPQDHYAKQAINKSILLDSSYTDDRYLNELGMALSEVETEFNPEFIIYNAGTDILIGDRIGGLKITEEGIIQRDEMVFDFAIKQKVPILMVLSGGYQKTNASVIARSLININNKFKLF